MHPLFDLLHGAGQRAAAWPHPLPDLLHGAGQRAVAWLHPLLDLLHGAGQGAVAWPHPLPDLLHGAGQGAVAWPLAAQSVPVGRALKVRQEILSAWTRNTVPTISDVLVMLMTHYLKKIEK